MSGAGTGRRRPAAAGRPRSGARRASGRRTRRRRPATVWAAAWIPVVLVAVAVVVAVAWNADGRSAPAADGTCRIEDSELALTTEQASSAATIAAVGRARGLPERAVVIALATAQQESRLRNLDYGDRDSLGLFQQRPSQGWGSPEQVRDPVYAAGIFYDRLVQVPGWDTGRLTDVAQAVQRSGFPEAYQQHEGMAQELAGVLLSAAPSRLSCAYTPAEPAGRLSVRTAAAAGAVEAELGVPAGEEFGAVAVDAGAGWAGATWAVAHAQRLHLTSVAFAGRTWTPAEGWTDSGAADDTVRLEVAG
ncbi:hypothetical protein [Blastococcus sp. SYSU D00820]